MKEVIKRFVNDKWWEVAEMILLGTLLILLTIALSATITGLAHAKLYVKGLLFATAITYLVKVVKVTLGEWDDSK